MLLMVATQARKAETRQGSRKGLQDGEWHVEDPGRATWLEAAMVPAEEVAFPGEMLQQHLCTAVAACLIQGSLLAALQGENDARPAASGLGHARCPRDLLLHSSHLTLKSCPG